MKAFLLSLLTCSLSLCSGAFAALPLVEIKADKEKLGEEKSRELNAITINKKEVIYNVSITSKTAKPLSDLEVKYMIFYLDFEPSEPEKPTETSKTGMLAIKNLPGNQSVVLKTDPLTLTSATLDGNKYWVNGASNSAKDKITGVWIRVYMGTELVGEYANPSTIAKRQTWK